MAPHLWGAAGVLLLALGAAGWRIGAARTRHGRNRARRRMLEEDEYGARQLIQRTLDAKADLRRMAPVSRNAARRYQRLLALELASLEELERQMRSDQDEEAADYLAEAQAELAQLRTEVAWCRQLLRQDSDPGVSFGVSARELLPRHSRIPEASHAAHQLPPDHRR